MKDKEIQKSCIFCKIANGEIPVYQIYEDELVKAFLDVNPIAKGHTLVIPKKHYENIFETPDEVLERINIICKKLAIKIKNKLGATGINIINASGKDAQQTVFHLHYHIIPRNQNDNLDLWFHKKSKEEINLEEIKNKLLI